MSCRFHAHSNKGTRFVAFCVSCVDDFHRKEHLGLFTKFSLSLHKVVISIPKLEAIRITAAKVRNHPSSTSPASNTHDFPVRPPHH